MGCKTSACVQFTLLEFALSDAPEAPAENLLAHVSVEESMQEVSSLLGPADPRASMAPRPPMPGIPQGDLFAAESSRGAWQDGHSETDNTGKSMPFPTPPRTPGGGSRS